MTLKCFGNSLMNLTKKLSSIKNGVNFKWNKWKIQIDLSRVTSKLWQKWKQKMKEKIIKMKTGFLIEKDWKYLKIKNLKKFVS